MLQRGITFIIRYLKSFYCWLGRSDASQNYVLLYLILSENIIKGYQTNRIIFHLSFITVTGKTKLFSSWNTILPTNSKKINYIFFPDRVFNVMKSYLMKRRSTGKWRWRNVLVNEFSSWWNFINLQVTFEKLILILQSSKEHLSVRKKLFMNIYKCILVL